MIKAVISMAMVFSRALNRVINLVPVFHYIAHQCDRWGHSWEFF